MFKRISLGIFFFLATMLYSQKDSLFKYSEISLLTADPGSDLYSLFGHSAIRAKNEQLGHDVVFNYGTFDFRTPNFMLKFMRGKLPYHLTISKFNDFVNEYHYTRRGVIEQKLNLTNDDKLAILSFLDINARPENRAYKYDFFYDNCSTRIRDAFERSFSLDPNYSSLENVTLRDILHQYLTGSPWTKFGIDLVIGSKADKKSSAREQTFIPEKLSLIFSSIQKNSIKLFNEKNIILDFDKERKARQKPHIFGLLFANIVIGFFGFIAYLRKEKWLEYFTKIWFSLLTISFTIIILLWFATDHQATRDNFNILWINPLCWLFFIKKFKYKKLLFYVLVVVNAFCILNSFMKVMPQDMPALYTIIPTMLSLFYIYENKVKQLNP